MARRSRNPLVVYLKKSRHLQGCVKDKTRRTCSCGFYAAVDEYLQLLEIQKRHYEKLAEQIKASI